VALNVLAVLQDLETRDRVLELLSECGHATQVRDVPENGFRVISSQPVDLLILEYRGEARSLELIQRLKEERPRSQVIIITDQAAMSQREIPPQLGVRNLLYRPINEDVLARLIRFADQSLQSGASERSTGSGVSAPGFTQLVGSSPAFRSAVKVAEQAARSARTPVLVVGEPGTGKDLIAHLIHDQSARRAGPFVEVNCRAIPGELMESQLFGHEAGAFIDSSGRKLGLIELANGGTLYLDEVGEIELPLQAKLLRFLDSKRVRRVMSETEIEVDVRIVVSTRRDLSRDVAKRRFRTDLYNRLNGVQVLLPPLRERGDDVVQLGVHFLDRFARRRSALPLLIGEQAERVLRAHDWPGNVRELRDVMEMASDAKGEGTLRPEDLPIESHRRPLHVVDGSESDLQVSLPEAGVSLLAIEQKVIEAALDKCRGNVMEAARFLKIGRGALRYKIAKHSLEDERDEARALRKAS
jgi:DNA-binding NtrC family response regulator